MNEGTVIRCENKGEKWYVDGQLIASSSKADGAIEIDEIQRKDRLLPSFSMKGSLRVSSIELDF